MIWAILLVLVVIVLPLPKRVTNRRAILLVASMKSLPCLLLEFEANRKELDIISRAMICRPWPLDVIRGLSYRQEKLLAERETILEAIERSS
jgi:hypothetical protein